MRVKMMESFQSVNTVAEIADEGIRVSMLEKGEDYIVDLTLGNWLIDNHKAEEILLPVYGAKILKTPEDQPELRHDDEIAEIARPRKRARKVEQ